MPAPTRLISCAAALALLAASASSSSRSSPRDSPLRLVADIPLPGAASRFDYQSLDTTRNRLYLAHMGAGQLVVVDTRARRVVAVRPGLPRVTGVLAVPSLRRVYASAAGAHRVAVLDDSTLRVVAEIGGIRFPDAIAYAPPWRKVFVSDETGGRDAVIDARTNRLRAMIELGGEAGNTRYDPVRRRIWVAVQTRNELVALDPEREAIVGRYPLHGADRPHGFVLDPAARLAFVANEANATLLVVDLGTMRVTAAHPVGADPDVLAFDPGLHRLYVASESGVVAVFTEQRGKLTAAGTYWAPHAHSVAVDPRSHEVYLPLENVDGQPVLRVMLPSRK